MIRLLYNTHFHEEKMVDENNPHENSLAYCSSENADSAITSIIVGIKEGMENDFGNLDNRRELLIRRPSYKKILNDLTGAEVEFATTTSSMASHGSDNLVMTHFSTQPTTLRTSASSLLQRLTADDYLPSELAPAQSTTNSYVPEEQFKKRALRLLKNREAARECRRKKKEYIKCLEDRVSVLENQNKALIDELKSLKELYCQQQAD